MLLVIGPPSIRSTVCLMLHVYFTSAIHIPFLTYQNLEFLYLFVEQ